MQGIIISQVSAAHNVLDATKNVHKVPLFSGIFSICLWGNPQTLLSDFLNILEDIHHIVHGRNYCSNNSPWVVFCTNDGSGEKIEKNPSSISSVIIPNCFLLTFGKGLDHEEEDGFLILEVASGKFNYSANILDFSAF